MFYDGSYPVTAWDPINVIPAKAGIQDSNTPTDRLILDAGLRRHDAVL